MENNQNQSRGFLRRSIDLHRADLHTVVGWLEDDFHHFCVSLVHDGQTILRVDTQARRYPWSTCPGAELALQALVGQPMVSRASDIGNLIEMRLHCTHLFDLAGLVSAHAVGQRKHRRYDLIVDDREVLEADPALGIPLALGPGNAVLFQDGSEVLRWTLEDQHISMPLIHAGQSLQRGFREWTERMPEEEAEHATVLRRAIMVGAGRLMNLERFDTADQLGRPPVCYTFQHDHSAQARRMPDSRYDYSRHVTLPLSDLDNEDP